MRDLISIEPNAKTAARRMGGIGLAKRMRRHRAGKGIAMSSKLSLSISRRSRPRSASDEEIEASESANLDSLRYRDRSAVSPEAPAQGALVVLDP